MSCPAGDCAPPFPPESAELMLKAELQLARFEYVEYPRDSSEERPCDVRLGERSIPAAYGCGCSRDDDGLPRSWCS